MDKFFTMIGNVSSTAPGSTATINFNVPNDADFVIDAIIPRFELASAFSGAVAGTPLPKYASSTAANNTMPGMNIARLAFSSTNENWHDDPAGIDASAFANDGLPVLMCKPRLNKSATLICRVTNRSPTPGVNIQGQVLLIGRKV